MVPVAFNKFFQKSVSDDKKDKFDSNNNEKFVEKSNGIKILYKEKY